MDLPDLYLFTAQFPYGHSETFLENELPVVASRFNKVFIIPYNKVEGIRSVPANVVVIPRAVSQKADISIFGILLKEFRHVSNKIFFLKKVREWRAYLKKAAADAGFIKELLKSAGNNKFALYSFWMNDWALALSVLKSSERLDIKFLFRSAGFDIWDERHEGNYLPFRYFNYSQTSYVLPNSMTAANYLKAKNIFPEKIQCAYWGTVDNGINELKPASEITVVSCSNVIPLKRVGSIPDILQYFPFPVKWVHFGDGPVMQEVKAKAAKLPTNIRCEFAGNVPNSQIIEFYKNNPVHLFLCVSETEGLPVSIQEAISFGIPVIATNVGGIPEIVSDKTGYLIPKDFDTGKVAELISEFRSSEKNTPVFREGVRSYWKEKFEASQVYNRFCDLLFTVLNRNQDL